MGHQEFDSQLGAAEIRLPKKHVDMALFDADHDGDRPRNDADDDADGKAKYKVRVVWANVIKFTMLHMLGLVGIIALPFVSFKTILWAIVTFYISGLGVTAGAHRLWTHRSYKARFPLRLFLTIANTMASENSIYTWTRDHRTHHKYSETDADPHNAKRGFFFAHIGWLMCRKHPEVLRLGKKIDMSDLRRDSLVMFQHRHYVPLAITVCFLIPSLVPVFFWNESFILAYFISVVRYLAILHTTWLVNSAAHLWGEKHYDIHINPAENHGVALLALGEGFHNYHHTFPHDYSTSEWRYSLNFTTFFIDVCAWIGMAYDRRSMSKEMVKNRILRTGPGTDKPVEHEDRDY